MNTISLERLVSTLKFRAAVQPSENMSDPDLEGLIADAVANHNPAYSVSAAASSVPEREKMAVIYLAWSAVCRIRASLFANQTDLNNGAGFASDRTSPFAKNLKLAEQLDKDYLIEIAGLGLIQAGVGPTMSNLVIHDGSSNAVLPAAIAPYPPAVNLLVPVAIAGDGTVTLEASYSSFPEFARLHIFYEDSSTAIYQPWNFTSTSGVPGIRNGLTPIASTTNVSQRIFQLVGFPLSGAHTHRFLAVLLNVNGLCSYSVEVAIVTT